MEKEKLIGAIKLLNTTVYEDEEKDAKVPLLDTKIKFVAVKQEAMEAAFIAACNSLMDTPKEEFVPQLVADVYNELVPGETAPADGAKDDASDAPAEEKAEEADAKSGKTAKTKTAGEKKTGNLPEKAKDVFGNVVNSMTGMFNALLVKGGTKEAIAKEVAKAYGRTEEKAFSNLSGHIHNMKSKNFTFTVKNDVFTLNEPK